MKNRKAKNDPTAILRNQTPFYSVIAALRIQKKKNSAFLNFGNDIPNQKPEKLKREADEWVINANMTVKIKN